MKLLHAFTSLLLAAAPALAQSTTPADPFNGVSVFSRVRGIDMGPGTGPTTGKGGVIRPVLPPPLFVGTLQEDGHITALLEVQSLGGARLLHVKEGDIVSWDQSRVLEISQGAIQLSSNGATPRLIPLGNNLLNQPIVNSPLPGVRNAVSMASPPTRTRRSMPLGTGPTTR